MADSDLVRVRLDRIDTNMGRAHAESVDAEILAEPVRQPDGRLRADTTHEGRPVKKKTSVAAEAAAKKAVTQSADNTKEKP